LAIDYIDNPENLSIKEYQEKINKEYKGPRPIYYTNNSSPIKVAGIDGFYEKDGDCHPYLCNAYTVPYRGKIWIIRFMNTTNENYLNEKEKILSTFKFTK
jgi:hypothetical protein